MFIYICIYICGVLITETQTCSARAKCRNVQQTAGSRQHAYSSRKLTSGMQHAACSRDHAAGSMYQAASSRQHAACISH
jgi:hypothetical protein